MNRDSGHLSAPLIECASEPKKKKSTLLTICPFILSNELCERLAYYGIATNLVIFLGNYLGMGSAAAAAAVNTWTGTCYLTAVLGAWVADTFLGRYKTILAFIIFYCFGMCMLATTAIKESSGELVATSKPWLFFLALYAVAVGTGGIKPNVSPFGADQFDPNHPQDQKEKESFFNWFYWSINIGALVSSLGIVYIQTNVSWALGFAIPAGAMFLSTLSFVAGSGRYKHVPVTGSPISKSILVLSEALFHNRAAVGVDHWLDKAKTAHGGRYSAVDVNNVRLVMRIMPVWCCCIMYWCVYCQMSGTFVQQGAQMNRHIGASFVIPAASLSSFDTISIIVLIPIFDRIIYPAFRHCGRGLTMLQRVGIGFIAAVLAMLLAAAVEMVRLQQFQDGNVFNIVEDHRTIEVVNISVFWQAPQYLMIGISEVLASIAQMEFFYDQAPDCMRSLCMALQLLTVSFGSYLSGALLTAVEATTNWIPRSNNLNTGHLDYFFVMLAVLMLVSFFVFLIIAIRYEYKDVKRGSVCEGEDEEEGAPMENRVASARGTRPRSNSARASRGYGTAGDSSSTKRLAEPQMRRGVHSGEIDPNILRSPAAYRR